MSDNAVLEDFGEKIGGARKDVFRKKFDLAAFNHLNEIERANLITRNAIWPSPLWNDLYEEHNVSAEMLLWIKTFRDGIAQSVEQSRGYRTWNSDDGYLEAQKVFAKFVCDVRDCCQEAMSNKVDLATLGQALKGICDERQKLLVSQSGFGIREFESIYTIPDYKSSRRIKGLARTCSRGNLIGYAIKSSALPAWQSEAIREDFEREITRTGFPNTAEAALVSRAGKNGLWILKSPDKGNFYIAVQYASFAADGAKEAAKEAFEGREFPTQENAKAALLDFMKEQIALRRDQKSEVDEWRVRPQLESVKRIGLQDYRKGENVTPEMFMATFGFRGGEFGNWLNQEDRQQTFNHAYDGLMDLARAAGVPPRSLSLGGSLAIAFGARGNGGRAAAHYEPARQVMNLTKMQGAGALAHEWAHALDNFLADKLRHAGLHKNNFLTDLLAEKKIHTGDFRDLPEDERKHIAGVLSGSAAFFEDLRKAPVSLEDLQKQARADIDRMVEALPSWLGIGRAMFDPQKNPFFSQIPDNKVMEWNQVIHKMLDPVSGFHCIDDVEVIDRLLKETAKEMLPQFKEMAKNQEKLRYQVSYYEDAARCGLGARHRNGLINNRDWLRRFHDSLERAPSAVGSAVKKSQFVKDALAKDSKRSSAYYSQPVELFARAFEFCVQQKIQGTAGRLSQYLVSGADVTPVYPSGDDAKRILASFEDHLVPAMQAMLGHGETLTETARTAQTIKLEIRDRMTALPPSEWGSDTRMKELSAEMRGKMEECNGISPSG